jgi:hypothetical protein
MKIKQVYQVKRINEILVNRGYQNSGLASLLPINFAAFLVFACHTYNKTKGKIIYLGENNLNFFVITGLSGKIKLNKSNMSLSYYCTNVEYILIYPFYLNFRSIYICNSNYKFLVNL